MKHQLTARLALPALFALGLAGCSPSVPKPANKVERVISMDASMAAAGLQITSIVDSPNIDESRTGPDGKTIDAVRIVHGFDATVTSDADVAGWLLTTPFDANDKELPGSHMVLVRAAGDPQPLSIAISAGIKLADIRRVAFTFRPRPPVPAR
jgi:hypothetical protein